MVIIYSSTPNGLLLLDLFHGFQQDGWETRFYQNRSNISWFFSIGLLSSLYSSCIPVFSPSASPAFPPIFSFPFVLAPSNSSFAPPPYFFSLTLFWAPLLLLPFLFSSFFSSTPILSPISLLLAWEWECLEYSTEWRNGNQAFSPLNQNTQMWGQSSGADR